MTVTLDIDEKIVERARDLAKRSGISLDEMIGDLLRGVTKDASEMSTEEVIRELRILWAVGGGHSGGRKWTREEMHERKDVP